MTSTPEDISTPQFAHAVRGYDRFQVDEYVERLNEWATQWQAHSGELERRAADREDELIALRARLQELESQTPTAPDEAIRAAADRAASAVSMAIRDAEEIRRRASEEAERRLDDAGRQALELLETARQSISGLAEEAKREGAQARERVEAMISEMRRQGDDERRRAEAEAERVLIEGRARAAELLADAEAEAEAARRANAEERRELEQNLAQLRSERAQIVGDLGRLRGAIQALIANSPMESEAGAPPLGEPASTGEG